jgi:hypothetical protein
MAVEIAERPTYAISITLLSFGQWGLGDGSHYFGHRQPVIPLRVGLAYSEDPGCHRTVIPGAALASFRYGILSIRQHGWRLVDGEGLDGVPVGNNLAHRMAPCVRGVVIRVCMAAHPQSLGVDGTCDPFGECDGDRYR